MKEIICGMCFGDACTFWARLPLPLSRRIPSLRVADLYLARCAKHLPSSSYQISEDEYIVAEIMES